MLYILPSVISSALIEKIASPLRDRIELPSSQRAALSYRAPKESDGIESYRSPTSHQATASMGSNADRRHRSPPLATDHLHLRSKFSICTRSPSEFTCGSSAPPASDPLHLRSPPSTCDSSPRSAIARRTITCPPPALAPLHLR
jgi:hypothetical protein